MTAVRTAVRRWDERSRIAYVLTLPDNSDLSTWRGLWDEMRLSPDLELLLIYNGVRWEASGWGRSGAEIAALLEEHAPLLARDPGAGLAAALDAIGGPPAAGAVAAPATEGESEDLEGGPGWGFILGVSGAFILGGGAFIISRRMKRAREQRQELETALASADETYAQVTLAADDLDEEQASPFQLRAAELRARLDDVRDAALAAGASGVTLGRIEQIEDELRALYSQVLQAQEAARTAPETADKSSRR